MTLKGEQKKSKLLRNMHFLCDAIDMKLSVEGTLKVQGEFLTNALDQFHFIVNLYSPYPFSL